MTLDEFLRTLETLIDQRETSDDLPGEGNFGCEDCRNCNHCRFCIGCDSCEDCTYCDESIDCTGCTQSKRCLGCTKVSYCEDCRDCKTSQYLTLCVECTDCVHCLACVGLEGAEFHVLNQKRTRKEYFALLRQVQEFMQQRMQVGWRAPAIGLASEVDDPRALERPTELSAAPWLDPPKPAPRVAVREPDRKPVWEPVREPPRDRAEPWPSALPTWEAPPIEREPASPWLDDEDAPSGPDKRGSLRRAGRPRRVEDEAPRETTGSGSYRTGSGPTRPASGPTQMPHANGGAPGAEAGARTRGPRSGAAETGSATPVPSEPGLRLGRRPKR